MILELEVSNQRLCRKDSSELANYSQRYVELSFDFKTSDWDSLVKFALFRSRSNVVYREAILEDKVCVPHSVLENDYFIFSVYGVDENKRVTTNQVKVYTEQSGYTTDVENDIPDDPTVVEEIYLAISSKAPMEHDHTLVDVTDVGTVEMEVTFDDESTATYNVVVKDESE